MAAKSDAHPVAVALVDAMVAAMDMSRRPYDDEVMTVIADLCEEIPCAPPTEATALRHALHTARTAAIIAHLRQTSCLYTLHRDYDTFMSRLWVVDKYFESLATGVIRIYGRVHNPPNPPPPATLHPSRVAPRNAAHRE